MHAAKNQKMPTETGPKEGRYKLAPQSRQEAAAASTFIGDRMAGADQTAAPIMATGIARTLVPTPIRAAAAGGVQACASAPETFRS